MNVKLFIRKAGRILMTCDRYLKKPVETVIFNFPTRQIYFKFSGESRPFALNCPVDDYIALFMARRTVCAIGFEENGELRRAVYVPLRVTDLGNTGG